MKIYTYSEARQRLAALLDQARREGEVQIRRRDGQPFVVQPAGPMGSPLDVLAISTRVTTEELVDFVRESRRSTERLVDPSWSTPRGDARTARRKTRKPRRRECSFVDPRGLRVLVTPRSVTESGVDGLRDRDTVSGDPSARSIFGLATCQFARHEFVLAYGLTGRQSIWRRNHGNLADTDQDGAQELHREISLL